MPEEEKKKETKDKPLPMLMSPTVRLIEPIRPLVVQWCHDKDTSFSVQSNLLWIDFLTGLGTINASEVGALKVEAVTLRKGGGSFRVKAAELAAEVERLKAKVASLQPTNQPTDKE